MFRSIVAFGMFLFMFAASCVFVSAQSPLTEIAYTSRQSGRSAIYRMRSDGSGKIDLSRIAAAQDRMPSWSFDGRKIAYVCGSRVCIMDADGRNKTLVPNVEALPSTPASYPVFSPDGSRIIYSRFVNSEVGDQLYSINVDGTNLTLLTAGSTGNLKASFSPDGSRLVFDSDRDANFITSGIFALNFNGGAVTPVVPTFSYAPDWSPDGARIAFTSNGEIGMTSEVFVVNVDGSNRYRVTDGLLNYKDDGSPAWSPDGTQIAFTSTRNDQDDIYVTSAAGGGTPTRLTFSAASESSPDWSSRPVAPASTLFDFDYDGKADQAVFRPSDGNWYLLRSTSGMTAAPFGLAADKIVPADYDADGKTDIAVYRSGTWYWLNSSNNSFSAYQFGLSGDVPVPFDYTGDKRAELAVYRSGIWYQLDLSNNQVQAVQFGIASDKPVPADYDNDGKIDIAVFREGTWYWTNSSNNQFKFYQFGQTGDVPVAGEYDGDGKTDIAVWRNGFWYIQGTFLSFYIIELGAAGDTPVPADYDADGRTDQAIYRNGIWTVRQSQQSNTVTVQFGTSGDRPVPAAFMP